MPRGEHPWFLLGEPSGKEKRRRGTYLRWRGKRKKGCTRRRGTVQRFGEGLVKKVIPNKPNVFRVFFAWERLDC